ncbi:MAG: SMR family transporter [Patescibacteria group bacterium]|nr:SMR family transporter [Patescibacteria group bacterium]MDD5715942.1 SMR family transporter [Patescibacteria group bacterium]
MANRLLPFALLFIGGIILTAGDVVMKQWVETNRRMLYIAGLIIYLLGMIFLAQSFRYKNIAIASVIFVFFNVATLLLVSWLYFKEGLTPVQLAGVALGLASVAIMELGS